MKCQKNEYKKLSEICEFIVDCPHSTASNEGVGIPLIRTPNIGKGRLILDGVHRVSLQVYKERTQRGAPQNGDIILAREAPAGNVALISNCEKVCLGQRTVLIRPDKNKVNPLYLVYYLLAPKQQYNLLGTANGATVAHVNMPIIRNLPITLPERKCQDVIGNCLSAYDDLIENNQKQIKLLEEAAQRLYKEWFVDLRFPGHENVKIIDGVPEGWNYKCIRDLGKVITGKTPSTSKNEYYGGDIPFVTIPDMHDCIYPLTTEKSLTINGALTQKNQFLPPNAIIVSCIGTVGLVNISIKRCQTNQQINSIILYNEKNLYFLYESLLGIKQLLDGVGSNGATMTNVNKSKFSNIKILYPTENLINRFYNLCEPFFKAILKFSLNIQHAKEARDRLLPKLMNGEIEV